MPAARLSTAGCRLINCCLVGCCPLPIPALLHGLYFFLAFLALAISSLNSVNSVNLNEYSNLGLSCSSSSGHSKCECMAEVGVFTTPGRTLGKTLLDRRTVRSWGFMDAHNACLGFNLLSGSGWGGGGAWDASRTFPSSSICETRKHAQRQSRSNCGFHLMSLSGLLLTIAPRLMYGIPPATK